MNEKDYFQKESKFLVNSVQEGDGLELLRDLKDEVAKLVIFDPQYEEINKVSTQHKNIKNQATFYEYPIISQEEEQIKEFCREIKRVLQPSGYLALWINKNILLNGGYNNWLPQGMRVKENLIWNKKVMGLGWGAFRNSVEYCLLVQKWPYEVDLGRKKGISNVFSELVKQGTRVHVHLKPYKMILKPYKMIRKIIKQLTKKGDLVIDPCAGSFISLTACGRLKRDFLGTDLSLRQTFKFNWNKENSRLLLQKEAKIINNAQ